MAALARRLAERFMPTLAEKLKQSADAKEKMRERVANKTKPMVVDIETKKAPPRAQDAEPTRIIRSTSSLLTTSCNDDPWAQWVSITATSNGTTTGDIWYDWNRQHTYASTAITTNTVTIWRDWVDQSPQRRGVIHTGLGRQVPAETPEQRRVREEQEAQYRREREAANARYYEEQRAAENRRKEADDRAMKLLVSMLNDQQKDDLKKYNHFFVEAPSGRLYRIDYGTHGNVKVVDRISKRIIERLCIQPNGVPRGDANLMQKLMIETAEDVFRSHANITLEDGRMVYGKTGLLDGDRLAEVIPIRRAA